MHGGLQLIDGWFARQGSREGHDPGRYLAQLQYLRNYNVCTTFTGTWPMLASTI